MEKYAHGNSGNGRGRIRARCCTVKAIPCERACLSNVRFLKRCTHFTHNVVVFHRNNIRRVILRIHSSQIHMTIVCRSTDEYICIHYPSTLTPHSDSPMTRIFLFMRRAYSHFDKQNFYWNYTVRSRDIWYVKQITIYLEMNNTAAASKTSRTLAIKSCCVNLFRFINIFV